MKLYMIRHGESVNNRDRLWTGQSDVPLTARGRADAARAREIVREIPFDCVWSSDLQRAAETARIALGDRPLETTQLLREVDVGTLAGTRYDAALEIPRVDGMNDYSSFGGESPARFTARIRAFREEVEHLDCDTVAAFCHAGVLREMLTQVLGIRPPSAHFLCANCTVAIFEYKNQVWKLHSWINPD